MGTGFKIRWSAEALSSLTQLYLYFESEWSAKEIKKFSNKLQMNLDKIVAFPYACPNSRVIQNVRVCFITKQTSLIYQIKDNVAFILDLIDNRMEKKTRLN